jgi:polyhydroxyalkanoate synthesis repressor PhaR
MAEDAEQKILEIKKYPNRRYYDATHSRHLTLEEIRSLIQQGYDIRVIDAKTSADITAQVLTQLILELDTPKLDSLPVPLLVRLIRMNDQLVKDFIEKYFNQALKSFFDYQKQLEEQIRKTHGLPPVFPSVSAWTKAMLEPFSAVFSGAAEVPPTPPSGKDDDLHKLVAFEKINCATAQIPVDSTHFLGLSKVAMQTFMPKATAASSDESEWGGVINCAFALALTT